MDKMIVNVGGPTEIRPMTQEEEEQLDLDRSLIVDEPEAGVSMEERMASLQNAVDILILDSLMGGA